MSDKSKHLTWVDVTRVVAILLVVLLHTFTATTENNSQLLTVFLKVVAKVGVPLFIMLSGALLLSKQESWQIFFTKRIKRVVVPWVVWAFVLVIVFQWRLLFEPVALLVEFKRSLIADFTFLPLLFCLYLLIPPLRIVVKHGEKRIVLYLLCLWFVALSLLPYVRNSLAFPLSVDNGLVTQTVRFSGFLLAGWWLARVKIKTVRKKGLAAFCAGALFLWTTWLVLQDARMDFSSYLSPWVVAASALVFLCFANVENQLSQLSPNLKQKLRLLGKTSFGVFLIHNGIKQVVAPLLPITTSALVQNFLLWLMVTGASYGVIILLAKQDKLRQLVT